jgi:hypothetical protein
MVMRIFRLILGIALVFLLTSCSTVKEEQQTPSVQPDNDVLAQFASKGKVYSLEGNHTPANKIGKEIGEIGKVTNDITKSGEGKVFDTSIKLQDGTKIYAIKDVDAHTVVAVKVNDIYYTAIFTRKLE